MKLILAAPAATYAPHMSLPRVMLLTALLHLGITPSHAVPRPWSGGSKSVHVLDDGIEYVTRPEIQAPRWNVTIYQPDRVSPGYWFVAAYDYLDQFWENGGRWNAPHIFDATGELVWSGAYLSKRYDSFDFRISNVLGEDMITWLYPRNRTGVIMDSSFNIRSTFATIDRRYEHNDMHELQFVDNGTSVLYFYDQPHTLSLEKSQAIGYMLGPCRVFENAFRERDLELDQVVFDWSPSEHIDVGESTYGKAEYNCMAAGEGYDFLHANSLDKFPDDGSYLLSGRHTDAIYKIAANGTVLWRFGGPKSDFVSNNITFKRQHHARVLASNATHATVSLFDNASAEDLEHPVAPYSRGLIFQLATAVSPMTATLLGEYPHPLGEGSYAFGRGSTQVLSNGNVFQCWVENCRHSEHAADGTLLMQASVKQEWLKSYRSYKFDFVGRPSAPPDIHSTSVVMPDGKKVKTVVHASWNGATEVATWVLYSVTSKEAGASRTKISDVPRTRFETRLEVEDLVPLVQVEALDRNGDVLGTSETFRTLIAAHIPDGIVESAGNVAPSTTTTMTPPPLDEQAGVHHMPPHHHEPLPTAKGPVADKMAAARETITPIVLWTVAFVVILALIRIIWMVREAAASSWGRLSWQSSSSLRGEEDKGVYQALEAEHGDEEDEDEDEEPVMEEVKWPQRVSSVQRGTGR